MMAKSKVATRLITATKIEMLDTKKIRTSPFNKRLIDVGADSFKELVQSVHEVGVIEPALVRPIEDIHCSYEVIFGSRRLQACIANKLPLPALVQDDLSTQEVVTLIVVENMDREDLTAMEEAQNVATLLTEGFDVTAASVQLGKPVSFIRNRAQLIHLTDGWQGVIGNHQVEVKNKGTFDFTDVPLTSFEDVARLPAETQAKVMKKVLDGYNSHPRAREITEAIASWTGALDGVSFPLEDATLLAKVGGCHDCPKRQGARADLFGVDPAVPVQKDICLDSSCREKKANAFDRRELKRLREKYPDAVEVKVQSFCVKSDPSDTYANSDGYVAADGSVYAPVKTKKGNSQLIVTTKGNVAMKYGAFDRKDEHRVASTGAPSAPQPKKTIKQAREELQAERERYVGQEYRERLAMPWSEAKTHLKTPTSLMYLVLLSGGAYCMHGDDRVTDETLRSDDAAMELLYKWASGALADNSYDFDVENWEAIGNLFAVDRASIEAKVVEDYPEPEEWAGLGDRAKVPEPKKEK
jgi:ParB/RepB/Spo0J family partition protein